MRKLVVLLGLASFVLAGSAIAQVDPDTDMLGIYFDEGATEFCLQDWQIGMPADAYLCITSPSEPSGVSGWECAVGVTEGIFVLGWNLMGNGALNASAPPNFLVGIAEALPYAPVMVVMNIQVGVFAAGAIDMWLDPANPSSFDPPMPGYAAGDDPGNLITLGYSAGGPGVVCAQINGDCDIVATEDATWGAVKATYK